MGKKLKLGRMVAKKQPQVVMIPPHMVQKLYCERYLSIQSMLEKKETKDKHLNIFGLHLCT